MKEFFSLNFLLLTAFLLGTNKTQGEIVGSITIGTCNYRKPHPTGSPCPNGYVLWQESIKGRVVSGFDITYKAGMNEETCRQFCWTYPGCVSADFHKNGICYLNSQATPISVDSNFNLLQFTCCRESDTQECQDPPSNTGGSGPCYSGSAKFLEPVPGKFISGQDLKVLTGMTVDSCRSACWETAGCRSADITNAGVCYLNSLSGPTTASSSLYSFIGFECCPGAEPSCEKKPLSPTGSPCASASVKWADPKQDKCVLGNDIFYKGGMTVNSCRDLCWMYPGCVSADLTTTGVCYLNSVTTPVSQCLTYSLLNFECCSESNNNYTCESKDLTSTGSPCPSGSISWKAIRPGEFVSGYDITYKAGMTVESCREFCWSYPGCVSADLTNTGVCYLNHAKGPVSKNPLYSLLEFDCCNDKPEPKCTSQKSQADNSGPCFSSVAKFVDYKPGKYVAGNDLKVVNGQTVESCRQLCWDTPRCKSADITQAGVCYLNSVREPLTSHYLFSFIDFDCCDAAEPQCENKTVLPTGGPCPSGSIKWANPKEGFCVSGHDITWKAGMDIDSCRDFCWTTPGCVSADLHINGICYLNVDAAPVTKCVGLTLLEFECCPGPEPTCEKKPQTPTGSPCPSGYVIWKEPRPATLVAGQDIIYKAGMTIETCRDFCWSYPGCVSADLATNGVCFLNSATGPATKNSLYTLLEFECCNPNSEPACVNPPSAAGNSGPCYSGSAKFLDYQPGKVVSGYDLKTVNGQTVESCRMLCWDTPNCKNAVLTHAGVCSLKSARSPVSANPLFSFIDFECCDGVQPTCQQKAVSPTGSPCSNGYVQWTDPLSGSCIVGKFITYRAGMTIESCREFCWTYPGCVSAQLRLDGVCFVNHADKPVQACPNFVYLGLQCCSNITTSECVSKNVAKTGSPCPTGSVQWKDPKPSLYVPGNDLAVKGGMTIEPCREFCWSYPGCVSADLTQNGVCYLNSVTKPTAINSLYSLLEFECCGEVPEPTCQSPKTDAETSGPCYSGTAKFMEYQPGKYISGHDIKVERGHSVESCRNLCWNTPFCQCADLTYDGICYLNNVKGPVSTSPYFSLIDFQCCSVTTPCEQRKVSDTGSPCPNGYIRWEEPKKTYYVPGNDIISKGGMTIDSCQDWCWTYPGCVSADITNAGVCYLNYATGPMATSEAFTLLQFECCKADPPLICNARVSNAGGSGPCDSGIAKFPSYVPGKFVRGLDIKVAYGQTVETCQQLCWDTPWCKSADITNAGVCYLNNAKGPLSIHGSYSYIGFECCQGDPPLCQKQTIARTGSPCPLGYVRWMEPKVNYYVPGYDLVSQAGMTRDTCRDYCWSYPGCVSADLTTAGVCHLNYRSVPVVYNTNYMLLEFECCAEPTQPMTTTTTPRPTPTVRPTALPTAPPCTEDTKVDITFVLDGSGSIGADNYHQGLKTAVKGIIDYMLPGVANLPSNSRVAAIAYSDKSVLEWNLNKYKTKNQLFQAVDDLPYYDSSTATGDALHDVLTQVHPTVRTGVKHLVILITDGESNDGIHVDTEEAQKLKDVGATIFAVGVGDNIKKDILDTISTGPDYRADVSSYSDLAAKMRKLAILTCQEAVAD